MAPVTVTRPRRRSLKKSYLAAVPRRPGLRGSLLKSGSPLFLTASRNIGDFSQTESAVSVTSSSSSSEDLSSEEEHWWVKNYHSRLISKDSSAPTRVLRKRKPSDSRVLVLRIRQYSGHDSLGSSGLRSGIPLVSSKSSVHPSSTPPGVAINTWQNCTRAGSSGSYWLRSSSQAIPKTCSRVCRTCARSKSLARTRKRGSTRNYSGTKSSGGCWLRGSSQDIPKNATMLVPGITSNVKKKSNRTVPAIPVANSLKTNSISASLERPEIGIVFQEIPQNRFTGTSKILNPPVPVVSVGSVRTEPAESSARYWLRSSSRVSRYSRKSSIPTPASPATNARKQDSSSELLKEPGPRSRAISKNKPLVSVKGSDNRQKSKVPAPPVLRRSQKTNAESSGSAAFRRSVPATPDNSSPRISVRVLSSRNNLNPHGASSAVSSDRIKIDVTQSSESTELNNLENMPPVLERVLPETAGNPAGLNKRDADGFATPSMPVLRPQVTSENIPPAATPATNRILRSATNRILRSSSIMRSVLNSRHSSPPAKKVPKHRSKYNRGEKDMKVIFRLEKQREADGWYAWMDTWEADLDRAIAAENATAAASNLQSTPTKMPLPGPAVEHARATTGQNATQTEIPLPAETEEVQFLCSFVPKYQFRYTRSALQAKSAPVIIDLTDSD